MQLDVRKSTNKIFPWYYQNVTCKIISFEMFYVKNNDTD